MSGRPSDPDRLRVHHAILANAARDQRSPPSRLVRISTYASPMWRLLLEALLGRRRVRALRHLVVGVTGSVILFVPGAATAIFRTAIQAEQARITPVLE